MCFVLPSIPWRPQYVLVKSTVKLLAKRYCDSEEEKKHSEVKYLRVKVIELDVRGEKRGKSTLKPSSGDCLKQKCN